jgi:hypothetical protein
MPNSQTSNATNAPRTATTTTGQNRGRKMVVIALTTPAGTRAVRIFSARNGSGFVSSRPGTSTSPSGVSFCSTSIRTSSGSSCRWIAVEISAASVSYDDPPSRRSATA